MSEQHLRLVRAFVALLVKRIFQEHAATMAAGYLEDMGYDDCPVCLANRHREAFA